jgi:hypothetical protein
MNCEDFDDWDNRTADERLAALEMMINEKLIEEGYDVVVVEVGDLDDAWAETDWDGHTVTIDGESLENGDVRDMVDTANHEAEHARQGQDGYWDDGNEDMWEDDAWDEGFAAMLEFEEECQPDPESSSEDEGIEFDWEGMGAGWEI